IIVIAAVEFGSWNFATVAMRSTGYHFFSTGLFSRLTEEQLARAMPAGWRFTTPRPAPSEPDRVCGTAFGDSFTYGDEVEEHEAWIHLLSRHFGCKIANYGMSGFGLDQAVLQYERVTPAGNLVILGLYVEMLRRAVAASWTFYDL